MGSRYCPRCGAEYRAGFAECSDCRVPLVDEEPTELPELKPGSEWHAAAEVFRSGRLIEAEVVRSFLESNGLEAYVWSSGLGPWRMEAQLTEMTGVPNDFNAHCVMVAAEQEDLARDLLDTLEVASDETPLPASTAAPVASPAGWMSLFRSRWVLVAFALILLWGMLMSVLPSAFD